MKGLWKGLSPVIRWLLTTLLLLLIVSGVAYAYVALTGTGEVTVEECLSWVGPSTFSVSLYPQESQVESLTLANASGVDMDIDITSVVTPDPGTKGLVIDVPKTLTVPAVGQIAFDITITAGKNAEPDTYTVTIDIVR